MAESLWDALLPQLITLAMARDPLHQTAEDWRRHYRRQWGLGHLRVVLEGCRIVGLLDVGWVATTTWRGGWTRTPRDAAHPVLYVNDLYVAPGSSAVIWRLRRMLPDSEVMLFHSQRRGGRRRVHLRRPYAISHAA